MREKRRSKMNQDVIKAVTSTLEELDDLDELDELETTSTYTIGKIDSDGKSGDFLGVAGIVTAVLSLIIAFIVFFCIVKKKTEPKSRFVSWLKEFLNFRKIWVAGLLKFFYIFLATATTIFGFIIMFYGGSEPWVMVLVGLGTIIFGNIGLRLTFEMSMIMIGLWENTADMRGALVGAKQRVEARRTAAEAKKEEQE